MSDEEDAAASMAKKPEVEWLFGRLGNTLRAKSDKVLKMKQDESSMCVVVATRVLWLFMSVAAILDAASAHLSSKHACQASPLGSTRADGASGRG